MMLGIFFTGIKSRVLKSSILMMAGVIASLSPLLAAQDKVPPKAIPKIIEISVAVEDVQASTEQYAELLGLSQWQYFDLSLTSSSNSVDTRPELRVARSQWQDITLELIQPLADASPVKDFLATRGEGIFSVGFEAESFAEQLQGKASVLFSAESAQGRYAQWWDTFDSLGIHLKSIASGHVHKPWGRANLPVDTELAARVFQLGIVVEDIKTTALQYQQLIGLAPWAVVNFQPPHVSNAQYLGAFSVNNSASFIQVGYGNWAGLQIELLAPINGPSPHRDYLITKGAGAHHLSFGQVKNHDDLVDFYSSKGLQLQMQSDNGGDGRTATYMASEKNLGFVLELTRVAKGAGSLRPSSVIGLMPASSTSALAP